MSYVSYYPNSQSTMDLPFHAFWPVYSKAMYILARTIDGSDINNVQALRIFINCLVNLLPNAQCRALFLDFLAMKPYVIETLRGAVPTVFRAYPWLESTLRTDAKSFHEMSLKNQDQQALFLWVYLLHAFLTAMHTQQTSTDFYYTQNRQNIIPTIQELRAMYAPEKITIFDWGNAIWFILHTTALYAPDPIQQSFTYYKTMIHALRNLLPCPKCRIHLTENLRFIDFDHCAKTREELFKCSWKLHNIVNASNNKRQLGLQEAFSLYTIQ